MHCSGSDRADSLEHVALRWHGPVHAGPVAELPVRTGAPAAKAAAREQNAGVIPPGSDRAHAARRGRGLLRAAACDEQRYREAQQQDARSVAAEGQSNHSLLFTRM